MIYDAHAWVGHWPFQPLPHRSVAELLRQMDAHGIDKALVGSFHGLFYRDAQEANVEVVREIGRRRDRLTPCATLNPTYPGWREDLRRCREEFGMPALRMTPNYHGYSLKDPCSDDMAEAAREAGMVVSLFGRVMDARGRHWMDPGRDSDEKEVADFLLRHPKGRFLLLNFMQAPLKRKWVRPKVYMDLARAVIMSRFVREALDLMGAERLVFGTSMLLRYPKPALLGIELAGLTKAQRAKIMWKNLAALLGERRR